MTAKLLQGKHLEKLLKGTNTTRRNNKSVGHIFHNRLSFAHSFGAYNFVTIRINYAVGKKIRQHADYFGARFIKTSCGGAHHSCVTGAENKGMTPFSKNFAEHFARI